MPNWNTILEFFTAARYYRPSGVGVQLIGIEPDVPVSAEPGADPVGRAALRERDLFPTALPAESETWRHPYPEVASELRTCARRKGLADHRLRRGRKDGGSVDYPLAVARDALVCRLTQRI